MSSRSSRKDDWKRGFVVIDFHQSDDCLPKSSRQHKLFFLEQISQRQRLRCCLMWCAVVFWSVLSLKIWNIYDEKLGEAGKWWGRFCNSTNWIKIVSYCPVYTCTELVIDIEKETNLKSILFACYSCSNDRCTNQISFQINGIDFDSIATLLGRFCTFP